MMGDTAEHPDNCVDPEAANYDISKNFRIDFNVPRCRKNVRNQGSCGSCYAFAATSAAQYQNCYAAVRSGDIGQAYQYLSPQHVDSCNVRGSLADDAVRPGRIESKFPALLDSRMGLCESAPGSRESGMFASRCESRVTITDSATRTMWGPPCEWVSDSRESGSFAGRE